jgi:hypothetical protein
MRCMSLAKLRFSCTQDPSAKDRRFATCLIHRVRRRYEPLRKLHFSSDRRNG